MNVSEPFIRRPVVTVLLTLAIAVAGAAAFFRLPAAPLPAADFPTTMVQAQLTQGELAGLLHRRRLRDDHGPDFGPWLVWSKPCRHFIPHNEPMVLTHQCEIIQGLDAGKLLVPSALRKVLRCRPGFPPQHEQPDPWR